MGRLKVGKQCTNNHTLLETDIGTKPNGKRYCKICHKISGKRLYLLNKPERTKYSIAWGKANPEKRYAAARKSQLKKYGIVEADFQSMLKNQNNVCAICEEPTPINKRLDIDHNHTTGKVRGLLCRNCNHGIGAFKERLGLLKRASTYMELAGEA